MCVCDRVCRLEFYIIRTKRVNMCDDFFYKRPFDISNNRECYRGKSIKYSPTYTSIDVKRSHLTLKQMLMRLIARFHVIAFREVRATRLTRSIVNFSPDRGQKETAVVRSPRVTMNSHSSRRQQQADTPFSSPRRVTLTVYVCVCVLCERSWSGSRSRDR